MPRTGTDTEAINQFESDTHRRVAANLSQPRSARELARFLHIHDPHAEPPHLRRGYRGRVPDPPLPSPYTEEGIQLYLDELEAEGLVVKLGVFANSAEAIDAVNKTQGVPEIPLEKVEQFVARAEHPQRYPFLGDEEQWIWTQETVDRLNGVAVEEVEHPPPLIGAERDI